jgi:formyltetrahydrofolate synthetase
VNLVSTLKLKVWCVNVVVAVNQFKRHHGRGSDAIKTAMDAGSLRCGAFQSLGQGGAGAVVFGEMRWSVRAKMTNFRFLRVGLAHQTKVEAITKEIYGADGVDYSKQQRNRLHQYEELALEDCPFVLPRRSTALN